MMHATQCHVAREDTWKETTSLTLPTAKPGCKADAVMKTYELFIYGYTYEGWNFNSGNYLFSTDTK